MNPFSYLETHLKNVSLTRLDPSSPSLFKSRSESMMRSLNFFSSSCWLIIIALCSIHISNFPQPCYRYRHRHATILMSYAIRIIKGKIHRIIECRIIIQSINNTFFVSIFCQSRRDTTVQKYSSDRDCPPMNEWY